jgi:hypothetical protein
MSEAYRKEGRFYISNAALHDLDDELYYVYIGEKKPNGFMELHFKAAGKTEAIAHARAEFMCILWSAARPGNFTVIDKAIEDIINKPETD